MTVREGKAEVPGATLAYRLVSGDPEQPLLVFENGWGAPYQYWLWVERELAGQAQLLFYDRAGIGSSRAARTPSVAELSAQFAALLDALDLPPAIVVGHSYGGLMAALHAVQQPQSVRGYVQLDGTPERAEATVDRGIGVILALVPMLKLLARLGLPEPVFTPALKPYPPEIARQIRSSAFGSARSLTDAAAELRLMPQIRAALAVPRGAQPHLAVTAVEEKMPAGLLRFLIKPELAQQLRARVRGLHQEQAAAGQHGRWGTLPHSHGGLVFTPQGAADSARVIREFLARDMAGAGA